MALCRSAEATLGPTERELEEPLPQPLALPALWVSPGPPCGQTQPDKTASSLQRSASRHGRQRWRMGVEGSCALVPRRVCVLRASAAACFLVTSVFIIIGGSKTEPGWARMQSFNNIKERQTAGQNPTQHLVRLSCISHSLLSSLLVTEAGRPTPNASPSLQTSFSSKGTGKMASEARSKPRLG